MLFPCSKNYLKKALKPSNYKYYNTKITAQRLPNTNITKKLLLKNRQQKYYDDITLQQFNSQVNKFSGILQHQEV